MPLDFQTKQASKQNLFVNAVKVLAALQLFWLAALRLVPSELPLSTNLPTSAGGTDELAAALWFLVSPTGFEHTRTDPIRLEILRLIHLAKTPF